MRGQGRRRGIGGPGNWQRRNLKIISMVHGLLMKFKPRFYRIFCREEYQAHARIESMDFTLFYDYDYLRDEKLSQLTDDSKFK